MSRFHEEETPELYKFITNLNRPLTVSYNDVSTDLTVTAFMGDDIEALLFVLNKLDEAGYDGQSGFEGRDVRISDCDGADITDIVIKACTIPEIALDNSTVPD